MNNEEANVMSEEISVPTEVNPTERASAELAPTEMPENAPAADKPDESEKDGEKQELLDRINELEAELLKEQVKVRLLILGILPEKLEDGAAMAYGLCLAGKDIDTAAAEIMEAYPHLKAVRREIPQFSSESAGSGDGFSAIRKIFSAR